MRILTICPTIYPEKFSKMRDSFEVTASKYNNMVVNSQNDSITKIINRIFEKYNDYDFYIVINDDIIFETPLWDTKLANKSKISHGKDAIPNGLEGQFFMIDGNIARAVGWLQMPKLNRYCGDSVWRFLGKQLNALHYVSEVRIRHNWEGADANINASDMVKFADWLPYSYKDIEKIRGIL